MKKNVHTNARNSRPKISINDTELRISRPKIFKNKTDSKVREYFPFCDFDTGLFLTCNQIFKCEKIQRTGVHLIIQVAASYLIKNENLLVNFGYYVTLGIMAFGIMSHWVL